MHSCLQLKAKFSLSILSYLLSQRIFCCCNNICESGSFIKIRSSFSSQFERLEVQDLESPKAWPLVRAICLYHSVKGKSCPGNHMVRNKNQKSQEEVGSPFYSSPCSQDQSTLLELTHSMRSIDTSMGRALRGMPKFYHLVGSKYPAREHLGDTEHYVQKTASNCFLFQSLNMKGL